MKYLFKEITTKEELIKLFKLRYDVYESSCVSGFLRKNKIRMDIDNYDLQSRHFGLYLVEGGLEKMIGGRRVIHKQIIETSSIVLQKLEQVNNDEISSPVLPLEIYGDSLSKENFMALEKNHGSSFLTEPSRLVVSDKYRNFKTGFFIIKATISLYKFLYKHKACVFSCNEKYASFYQKLGCKPMSTSKMNVGETTVMTFSLDFSDIPKKFHNGLYTQYEQYLEQDVITS